MELKQFVFCDYVQNCVNWNNLWQEMQHKVLSWYWVIDQSDTHVVVTQNFSKVNFESVWIFLPVGKRKQKLNDHNELNVRHQ